jgi:predicted nucleic acid-binding protein
MIADTNVIIDRHKSGEDIPENISIVSSTEFPPILESEFFEGEIYTLTSEDQVLAIKLQKKLRDRGDPVPAPDLLIAAAAINRDEKVVTNDEDFKQISSVSRLEIESDKG